ncbi:uncharacterized protein LOC120343565 [Styela clava]
MTSVENEDSHSFQQYLHNAPRDISALHGIASMNLDQIEKLAQTMMEDSRRNDEDQVAEELMNSKFLVLLLLVALLAIQHGDSWGLRRRRGKKGRGWRKAGKVLGGIAKVGLKLLGWDRDSFEKLAYLKSEDSDSFQEFLENAKDEFEDELSDDDMNKLVSALNSVSGMSLDEIEEFAQNMKSNDVEVNESLKKATHQLREELLLRSAMMR